MRFILIICLLVLSLYSKGENFIFHRLTTEEGLSSAHITSILQDQKGYIWMGTSEGLNRYDGYSFRTFLPESDNPESIQGNNIERLFEDSEGYIWIFFSSGGFSFYDPEKDGFVNYTKEWLQQQLRVYGKALCISGTVANQTWIGTENGLLIYNHTERSLKRTESSQSTVYNSAVNCIYLAAHYTLLVGTMDGYSNYDPFTRNFTDYKMKVQLPDGSIETLQGGINRIYRDKSDYLWIGTRRHGIYRTLEPGNKFIFQQVGDKNVQVYKFLETQNGNLWIGHSEGVSLIRRENRDNLVIEDFSTIPSSLESWEVRSIWEDKNGRIWFDDTNYNQGQFYYSPETNSIDQLRHVAENPYSISSNQITYTFIDRFNNLWIGHDNYGISHANLNIPLFNYTFGYATDSVSISSNQVLSTYEDSQQNLWVATIKGLDRINHSTGKIDKRYTFSSLSSSNTLSGRIIGSLTEDNENNLWITYLDTYPDRINLHTFEKKRYFPVFENRTESSGLNIAKASQDNQGNIWMTTSKGGFIRYNVTEQKSFYYPSPSGEYENNHSYSDLYSICIDNRNRIWMGMSGKGIRCFNPVTGIFVDYVHSSSNHNSLVSDYVHTLFCDASGYLWIGTNAGLDRFNEEKGVFEHFTVQTGLIGNIIQTIQEAEKGILFIGTNKGLSRLDIQTGQTTNYSIINGLLTNEFMPDAGCKRAWGEIVMGTNKGIVSFQSIALNNIKGQIDQPVFITDIYVGNERLFGKNIKLPYKESKDLRIDFLSFDYEYPRNNHYQYRLRGFDNSWKETDPEHRFVEYMQLPAGDYTFEVKVSKDNISWSKITTCKVIILPPWWRSWWFILLVFMTGIILLFLIYKSRVRWYRIRQKELEKKVDDRTLRLIETKQDLEEKNKELELLNEKLKTLDKQKTAFFTNISHELRTPLTIIKGLTENLEYPWDAQQDVSKSQNTVRTIQKNIYRLIRQVNELLDISQLEKGILQPHISYSDMSSFIRDISELFLPIAQKYDITFTCSISSRVGKAFFDKNIVEQAVFNLLSNAFKYTQDGGKIDLSVEIRDKSGKEWIEIWVEDNGIGIPKDSLPYIFDRYYQNKQKPFQRFESSGIGLAYAKDIIESHLGTISCTSEEGKGTVIGFTIPVYETAYPGEWMTTETVIRERNYYEKELTLSSFDMDTIDIAPSNKKQTLLFVEDNEDLSAYLADSFTDEYNIILAKNGEDGAKKAFESLPDAIISDIMMPVMDGLELCEILKTDERTAHIPVILLTARAEEQQQLEGYYAGADDYISKPFHIDVLRAKIKGLIVRKEKLQQHFKESFYLDLPDEKLPDVEQDLVRKATRVVLDNLQNPQFDVDMFCSAMAMSRANLFRKLKAATGFSASSFTRNIRIKRAAELLRNKEYTINEVAMLVGFSDPNYFSRCFKEIYGVTPSDFKGTE